MVMGYMPEGVPLYSYDVTTRILASCSEFCFEKCPRPLEFTM
ncbi:hypothetical protein OOU_Y34scaffold00233g18 [Pyricularia oryzae Y34]|uniref:Uncharacterized protein n=3 Tax=Pyricularia oryzae TaxID=318829 RepID=A0A4P7NU43_PYROR|nr:hypothetical protein OOU_Y34scaffold00233g18 [Pyricularia oryzae Y34]QBZ65902.1 hypothetical protein PoMZ_12869 [Pyricularia oryzae]